MGKQSLCRAGEEADGACGQHDQEAHDEEGTLNRLQEDQRGGEEDGPKPHVPVQHDQDGDQGLHGQEEDAVCCVGS